MRSEVLCSAARQRVAQRHVLLVTAVRILPLKGFGRVTCDTVIDTQCTARERQIMLRIDNFRSAFSLSCYVFIPLFSNRPTVAVGVGGSPSEDMTRVPDHGHGELVMPVSHASAHHDAISHVPDGELVSCPSRMQKLTTTPSRMPRVCTRAASRSRRGNSSPGL